MGLGQDQTHDPSICSQTRICCQTHYRLGYTARFNISYTMVITPLMFFEIPINSHLRFSKSSSLISLASLLTKYKWPKEGMTERHAKGNIHPHLFKVGGIKTFKKQCNIQEAKIKLRRERKLTYFGGDGGTFSSATTRGVAPMAAIIPVIAGALCQNKIHNFKEKNIGCFQFLHRKLVDMYTENSAKDDILFW